MRLSIIILFAFLFMNPHQGSSQVVIADSLQTFQYYHGKLDNPYRVRDTVDGKIRDTYIQFITPYDYTAEVGKIERINDKQVVGIWILDTVNPKWEAYKLNYKKNHDFLVYDSANIFDKIKDKEIRVERILKGRWKIQNDTLYTNITGCITCEGVSWKVDVGEKSEFVCLQNKIYKTIEIYKTTEYDRLIFTTRRYKKISNK